MQRLVGAQSLISGARRVVSARAAKPEEPVHVVLLMGVCGSGKSTVGRLLAKRLDWTFLEADTFHLPEARQRMAQGQPLDEADREPWIARIAEALAAQLARREDTVLACSALRAVHRDRLAQVAGAGWHVVHLAGPAELIAERLRERRGHYAGPELLESQLATLENPTDAQSLSIDQSPKALVDSIASWLDGEC